MAKNKEVSIKRIIKTKKKGVAKKHPNKHEDNKKYNRQGH